MFGNCRSDVRIFLNGCAIPRVNSTKYLGVVFDAKLNFQEHFDNITEKVNTRIAILRKLSFNSKISTSTKTLLFKALIRPLLEYSCPAFIAAPDAQLKKLQVLQNKALTLCLNITLMDKVRTTVLHNVLQVPTVVERFINLASRFGNRAMNQVGPVAHLIQANRTLRDSEFTPLAKFQKNIMFGPPVLF